MMKRYKGLSKLMEYLFQWRNYSIIVFGVLSVVIALFYSATVDAPFQGDDFRYVRHLVFHLPELLDGQGWDVWLSTFSGFGAWSYFRPAFQLSYLCDFLVWGLNPIGYHLSNLGLHLLTAFLVFVLCWLLTHRRAMALVAGLFFALMPIHVEAVSWFGARADVLVTFGYVLSFVFFVLFHRAFDACFLIASVGAFTVALLAKESALTLPLMLIVYDWLYNREVLGQKSQRIKRYVLFWSVLAIYFVIRIVLWNSTGSFPVPGKSSFSWDHLSQAYVLALMDPFLADMTSELRWFAILGAGLLLLIYRSRRELWFAAIWCGVTIVPSLASLDANLFDRYVYLPSVGLAIALASLMSNSLPRFARLSYGVAIVLCLTTLVVYASGLYTRNAAWARAAEITQLVIQQVRSLHPTIPADARLIFTNVPVLVGGRGMQAFGGKLPYAMQLAYKHPNLEVHNLRQFPILTDRLERTYFFEYNRRQVTERVDLIRLLQDRSQCLQPVHPAIIWDFRNGLQGWEAWNDLSTFEVYDEILVMRSEGNDPYLASPEINIPAIAIANVEIMMRVIADQPTVEGRVYWLASSSNDFEPGLYRAFVVKADGEFHTYRVEIWGQPLYIGDHIRRLRLDPTDAQSEIAIRMIRINALYWDEQSNRCAMINTGEGNVAWK